MPRTLAQKPVETERKSGLNGAENPSQPLVENDQFLLGSADERCLQGAVEMALAVKDAQRENGFTLSTIGSLIGKDAVAAHRAFDAEDPSTVMRALAALLLLDKKGVWLGRVARLTGRQVVDRPRLTKDQKCDRYEEFFRRMGKTGEAMQEEALGDEL